jgi:hypothetical protein
MYMMRMYYSIVHTHHIHRSDMYIHVYARWVGFQMIRNGHSTQISNKNTSRSESFRVRLSPSESVARTCPRPPCWRALFRPAHHSIPSGAASQPARIRVDPALTGLTLSRRQGAAVARARRPVHRTNLRAAGPGRALGNRAHCAPPATRTRTGREASLLLSTLAAQQLHPRVCRKHELRLSQALAPTLQEQTKTENSGYARALVLRPRARAALRALLLSPRYNSGPSQRPTRGRAEDDRARPRAGPGLAPRRRRRRPAERRGAAARQSPAPRASAPPASRWTAPSKLGLSRSRLGPGRPMA